MNTPDTIAQITNLFTQTSLCVDKLSQCLTTELECLKNNQTEQLLDISSVKETQMHELNTLDQQRKQLTTANKIDTREAYLDWLDALDPTMTLRNKWLEISDAIKQCQKQNATNGIISEKMTQASFEALNILSGNALSTDSTYTAAGTKPGSIDSLHNTTA